MTDQDLEALAKDTSIPTVKFLSDCFLSTPETSPDPKPTQTVSLGFRQSRADAFKLRYDLIPPEAEAALASVLTFGASKYNDRNWELGLPWMETVASLRRHLAAFVAGEDLDPESGLPHVAHIITNAAFLVTMTKRRPDLDDRPHGVIL
jgi:hypothetical protein